jgi:hypothetical protein
MTQTQLRALAIYRNHKYCKCLECELARALLRDMDKRAEGDPISWDDVVASTSATWDGFVMRLLNRR